jgi:hypothetical protein
MSSKSSEFGWLASQADPPKKKKDTITLDELLKMLKELKKEHGGEVLMYVRDEYEGHRSIKDVLKLYADESKLYID